MCCAIPIRNKEYIQRNEWKLCCSPWKVSKVWTKRLPAEITGRCAAQPGLSLWNTQRWWGNQSSFARKVFCLQLVHQLSIIPLFPHVTEENRLWENFRKQDACSRRIREQTFSLHVSFLSFRALLEIWLNYCHSILWFCCQPTPYLKQDFLNLWTNFLFHSRWSLSSCRGLRFLPPRWPNI